MDIWVTFDADGRWTTFPDPAIVRRGSEVTWRFQTAGRPERGLIWEVIFNESPFKDGRLSLDVGSTANQNLQHLGSVTDEVDKPGDYKYGVRVRDEYARIISDDDPYLMVSAIYPDPRAF